MTLVRDVIDYLEELAPPALAEDWDNVGLLMGDPGQPVSHVMACLTLTDETVTEARDRGAELVISHHPLPFRPLAKITSESMPGGLVWRLAAGQIAVYSPHTAFDSASRGINQRLADGLQLESIRPLRPVGDTERTGEPVGGGRIGELPHPISLKALADRLKQFLGITRLQLVGQVAAPVSVVAIACGAADEFLDDAITAGCDVFVLGEARFHTLLRAQAHGLHLLLPGHFASERFAVERVASELSLLFPDLVVWSAEREADPLQSL